MRCFVAVKADGDLIRAIEPAARSWREAAERAGLRVSWARPEGWHVTVKFLGEIDEERAGAVGRLLATVAAATAPFPVRTAGVLTLPAAARVPNVLAVALMDDDDRLSRLARDIDDALANEGFEPATRPFRAHITVGRIRAAKGREGRAQWKRFVASLDRFAVRPARAGRAGSDEISGRGRVERLTLYRSELGDGPARYHAIAEYALDGAS